MGIAGLDHMVLTTNDGARLAAFYRSLGLELRGYDDWQSGSAPAYSVVLGDQKLNVHPENLADRRREPAFLGSHTAQPGCGDLCLVWDGSVDDVVALLTAVGVAIETGPVERIGGRGGGTAVGRSVYVRDPDDNLVELITYC